MESEFPTRWSAGETSTLWNADTRQCFHGRLAEISFVFLLLVIKQAAEKSRVQRHGNKKFHPQKQISLRTIDNCEDAENATFLLPECSNFRSVVVRNVSTIMRTTGKCSVQRSGSP
jgi:hypothetical protein